MAQIPPTTVKFGKVNFQADVTVGDEKEYVMADFTDPQLQAFVSSMPPGYQERAMLTPKDFKDYLLQYADGCALRAKQIPARAQEMLALETQYRDMAVKYGAERGV